MKVKADQMRKAAGAAEEMLKALANRHRLLILCQLAEEERCVGDLAGFLGLRDSTVSQHLALLRKDDLVATRREGQTVWYRLASKPAARLIETLYGVYCAPERQCRPAKPRAKTTGARKIRKAKR
jgi:DNA-binding transcriptional ArsR family regulator